jgi:hypothetical protein
MRIIPAPLSGENYPSSLDKLENGPSASNNESEDLKVIISSLLSPLSVP